MAVNRPRWRSSHDRVLDHWVPAGHLFVDIKGRARVNTHVVLRLLDTFFRHKWLYLVPVVLMVGVGLWAVTSAEDSYQSFGTVKVESNALLAELTGSQQDPGFGWQTPAGYTADSFNALLRTQTFLDDVVENAGLEQALASGQLTGDDVRASISVYPDGMRLVKVVGTSPFPDVAHRVAEGAMESYVETVRAYEVSDNTVAIEFLRGKLPDYEADVAAAETDLTNWLADHPAPEEGERPEGELVELRRLESAIQTRQERLVDIQNDIAQAELSVEQKSAEVRQRYAVIDPPQEPTAAQPSTKKAIITMAMALIVGCLVSLAGVVIGTILDHTIRFPGDVKERLHTRVLAVVPLARMTAGMRARFETPEGDVPTLVPAASNGDGVQPAASSAAGTVAGGPIDDGAPAAEHADDAQEPEPAGNGPRRSVTLKRVT